MRLRDFFLDCGDGGKEDDEPIGALQSSLLLGPSRSGKTTLLFNYACKLVMERGYRNVVFICKRSNMEDGPPFLQEDFNTTSEHLRRISFKYVNDNVDINKYFAAFHLSNPLPEAVIIDSFSDFFEEWLYEEDEGEERPSERAMVNTLAICLDAMECACQNLPLRQAPKLLIADTQEDAVSYMYIYRKYLKQFFFIKSRGSSKFFLSEEGHQGGSYAECTFDDSPIQLDILKD